MNKKLKIVWICHFTNFNITRKLGIARTVSEMAPWISLGIGEMEKRNDIEFHIISPYPWITGIKKFTENNIHYHFFNSGIPFIGRHWPQAFRMDILTNFRFNNKSISNIVNRIMPDLIHLHGFENAYYSSSILALKDKFPILITVQGFITLQIPKGKLSLEMKKRIDIEKQIIGSFTDFGVRTDHMKQEIINNNVNANFHWHEYFINDSRRSDNLIVKDNKNYDLIFFARISKEKGIEDLILALGRLVEWFPDINLAVVGGCGAIYLNELKQLSIDNGCEKNIDFIGFLPSQEEVYNILEFSKISVLPTYNDIIPGTIIESMLRKIPVVSYATGGIPSINEHAENIKLIEQGDIDSLVDTIRELLNNDAERQDLAERGYSYARNRWNNQKAMDDIINIYHDILNLKNSY